MRTTLRIGLTDDGALYHQRATAMLHEMGELESTLRGAVATVAGRLRVDVPGAVGRHVVGLALPEFFSRYPDIVLELGSTDRSVDLIVVGVDCVIRGTLVSRPLGSFAVVTSVATAYLARHGIPHTLQNLQGHRLVNFHSAKTGKIFPFDFAKGNAAHQIVRPHWVLCKDANTYLAAGPAGMGLMQNPRTWVVSDLLASGQLVWVMQDWSAGDLPMMVLYPRNSHLTARVSAFADWVTTLFHTEFEAVAQIAG